MSKIIDIGKWKDALAEAASQDIVLAAMIKYKMPLTRKNYIQSAYCRRELPESPLTTDASTCSRMACQQLLPV